MCELAGLKYNVDLSSSNTLALKSHTQYYIALQHIEQLPEILNFAKQKQLNIFILSGGSNLLLPEKINALTVHIDLMGKDMIEDHHDHVIVKASAGENWHDFVGYCCEKSWHGLENLALIPGRIGASPIQNIGAYGVEVGDFIEHIWAYDFKTEQHVKLAAQDCQFAYRDSIFKQQAGRYLIYAVSFRLLKQANLKLNYADVAERVGEPPTAKKLLETIIKIRQQKLPQPSEFPNAGSFFKNPILDVATFETFIRKFPHAPHYPQYVVHHENTQNTHLETASITGYKIAAGWLIEQAGWKGKRLGQVGMFDKQALVLVNYADASLANVQHTYQQIQKDISQKFAIRLEPEPVLLNETGEIIAHHNVVQNAF